MYLENRNPPTIIVMPRISEATLAIGAFGLLTLTFASLRSVVFVLRVPCVFVFGLGVASQTLFVCVTSLGIIIGVL